MIVALWQTRKSATSLAVKDEIENGVAYHPLTFFQALPALYQRLDRQIEATWGQTTPLPSFIRVGSWIGGDRDGNPMSTPWCCATR